MRITAPDGVNLAQQVYVALPDISYAGLLSLASLGPSTSAAEEAPISLGCEGLTLQPVEGASATAATATAAGQAAARQALSAGAASGSSGLSGPLTLRCIHSAASGAAASLILVNAIVPAHQQAYFAAALTDFIASRTTASTSTSTSTTSTSTSTSTSSGSGGPLRVYVVAAAWLRGVADLEPHVYCSPRDYCDALPPALAALPAVPEASTLRDPFLSVVLHALRSSGLPLVALLVPSHRPPVGAALVDSLPEAQRLAACAAAASGGLMTARTLHLQLGSPNIGSRLDGGVRMLVSSAAAGAAAADYSSAAGGGTAAAAESNEIIYL